MKTTEEKFLGNPCFKCNAPPPSLWCRCKKCLIKDYEKRVIGEYIVVFINGADLWISGDRQNLPCIINIDEAYKEIETYGFIEHPNSPVKVIPNINKLAYRLEKEWQWVDDSIEEARKIIELPNFEIRRLAARMK